MAAQPGDFGSIYGDKETFQHVKQLPPNFSTRILNILQNQNMKFTDEEKINIVNKYTKFFEGNPHKDLNNADLQRFVDEEWRKKYPVSSFTGINSSPKVPVQGGRTLQRRKNRSSRRSLRRIRRTRRRV